MVEVSHGDTRVCTPGRCATCGAPGWRPVRAKPAIRIVRGVTVRGVLAAAGELLDDPARWTWGVKARDVGGRWVDPNDDAAVAWSLRGAVHAAAVHPFLAVVTIDYLYRFFDGGLDSFNDSYGLEGVHGLIGRAILSPAIEEC